MHLVEKGIYLATYILKPNKEYDTATVSTVSFCVREKKEDWEDIRIGMIEGWKKQELIAIDFTGKEYEYISLPNPKPKLISYQKTEFGIKLTYPKDEPLFFPHKDIPLEDGEIVEDLEDVI